MAAGREDDRTLRRSHNLRNGDNKHGGWNKNQLRKQRSSQTTAYEPHDGPPKLRLRRSAFDHVPSVITDICGSLNTNIRIVAMPFTTADRVLEVTRSAGFKCPAYSDAKTPVVQRAIAATLSAMTHGDMPSVRRICLMLAAAGFAMRNKSEPPPRAGSEGQESERLSQN